MPHGTAAPAAGGSGVGEGTGGSEADRLEQATPLDDGAAPDEGAALGGGGIAGEGTGGSEADRLEQATDVPLDAEDAFPHGSGDAEDAFPDGRGDDDES